MSLFSIKKNSETADMVTFTEEILNGKLHFLCSVRAELNCNVNLASLWDVRGFNIEKK